MTTTVTTTTVLLFLPGLFCWSRLAKEVSHPDATGNRIFLAEVGTQSCTKVGRRFGQRQEARGKTAEIMPIKPRRLETRRYMEAELSKKSDLRNDRSLFLVVDQLDQGNQNSNSEGPGGRGVVMMKVGADDAVGCAMGPERMVAQQQGC